MTSDVSLVLTSDSCNDLMKLVTIALWFYDTSTLLELFVYYGCHERWIAILDIAHAISRQIHTYLNMLWAKWCYFESLLR